MHRVITQGVPTSSSPDSKAQLHMLTENQKCNAKFHVYIHEAFYKASGQPKLSFGLWLQLVRT